MGPIIVQLGEVNGASVVVLTLFLGDVVDRVGCKVGGSFVVSFVDSGGFVVGGFVGGGFGGKFVGFSVGCSEVGFAVVKTSLNVVDEGDSVTLVPGGFVGGVTFVFVLVPMSVWLFAEA